MNRRERDRLSTEGSDPQRNRRQEQSAFLIGSATQVSTSRKEALALDQQQQH